MDLRKTTGDKPPCSIFATTDRAEFEDSVVEPSDGRPILPFSHARLWINPGRKMSRKRKHALRTTKRPTNGVG